MTKLYYLGWVIVIFSLPQSWCLAEEDFYPQVLSHSAGNLLWAPHQKNSARTIQIGTAIYDKDILQTGSSALKIFLPHLGFILVSPQSQVQLHILLVPEKNLQHGHHLLTSATDAPNNVPFILWEIHRGTMNFALDQQPGYMGLQLGKKRLLVTQKAVGMVQAQENLHEQQQFTVETISGKLFLVSDYNKILGLMEQEGGIAQRSVVSRYEYTEKFEVPSPPPLLDSKTSTLEESLELDPNAIEPRNVDFAFTETLPAEINISSSPEQSEEHLIQAILSKMQQQWTLALPPHPQLGLLNLIQRKPFESPTTSGLLPLWENPTNRIAGINDFSGKTGKLQFHITYE